MVLPGAAETFRAPPGATLRRPPASAQIGGRLEARPTLPRAVLFSAIIALLLLAPAAGAKDPAREAEDAREDAGEGLGVAALALLVPTAALVPLNLARKKWLIPKLRGKPQTLKRVMAWWKKLVMPLHILTGVLALVVGIAHGLVLRAPNPLLWAAMVVMGALVIGGALLRGKWTPSKVRSWALAMHTQRAMLAVLVVLLVVGHAME